MSEAPVLDPAAISRRAERRHRHRVRAARVAAGLVVVGTTLVVAATVGDRGEERPPSNVVSGPGDSEQSADAPSPYDPPPCYSRGPQGGGADDGAVSDLDGVVAVRLCPDFDPRTPGSQPPVTPDQRAEVEDADALVHGLAGFAADVRDLPTALPEYCRTDSGTWMGQSFSFYRADGSRADLAAHGCELTTIEVRRVHGGALREVFLEALARQRAAIDYTRPFDDELTCGTGQRGGPIRPGRERLVAAVVCDLPAGAQSIPSDLEPVPLDSAQLAELDTAWADPGDPLIRPPSGEHECVDVPEPPSYIVAATDRSDVVQLLGSPCDVLVWHGWEARAGATIPTTLAALGLERRTSG